MYRLLLLVRESFLAPIHAGIPSRESRSRERIPARVSARWESRSSVVTLAFCALVLGAGVVRAATSAPDLVKQVDLEKVRLIAVQNDGRFKTFDTLAREIV